MIENAHWGVADGRGMGARGRPGGGPQEGVRGDVGVAADGDGDEGCAGGRGFGGGGGGGGGARGEEVAADADVGADDGAPAEDDVLGAVQLGAAGDFVAGVGGDEGGFGGFLGGGGGDGGGGHGEWRGGGWTGVWGGRSEGRKVGKVGRLSEGIGVDGDWVGKAR